MSQKVLRDIFFSVRQLVARGDGRAVDIDLEHCPRADVENAFNARQFCYAVKGLPTIFYAEAMVALPATSKVALLLHECGHIYLRAFGDDKAEVQVDAWVKLHWPLADYCYKDVRYKWRGEKRTAKALETVSWDFVRKMKG